MATPLGSNFRGPDGRLGYLLRQAQQIFRTAMEVVLGEVGITAAQFSLLSVIEIEPGLTGAELARDSMLTPQSTNEVLLALEGAGLIDRRPDPADRRVRRVFLTAAGRGVLADTHPRVRDLEARMVTGLSSRECAQLRTWLVRAAQALEASSSQPPEP
jgi:DNA-binding MarR family transcriptional regulator